MGRISVAIFILSFKRNARKRCVVKDSESANILAQNLRARLSLFIYVLFSEKEGCYVFDLICH